MMIKSEKQKVREGIADAVQSVRKKVREGRVELGASRTLELTKLLLRIEGVLDGK